MTDETQGTDAEGVDWGDVAATEEYAAVTAANAPAPEAYPEAPDNPHNHRFTLSVTGDKAPMMVIRANTAADMTAAINELEAFGVWANVGAAHATMRAQGALGNGLGPMTPVGPPQAPSGPPAPPRAQYAPPVQQSPGPPPFGANVSAPNAPGYQGPPPQQQWPAQPPQGQGGGWNGQNQSRGQEKPRPAGWFVTEVPYNDRERFRSLREKNTDTGNYLRGKIQWGGKGTYWVDPSVAAWLAGQGFPVTQ